MLQFMGLQKVGHDWVTELNLFTFLILIMYFECPSCPLFFFVLFCFPGGLQPTFSFGNIGEGQL